MFRDLAIKLLKDSQGVSQECWDDMRPMLEGDYLITGCVEAVDGRFYLPSDYRGGSPLSVDLVEYTIATNEILGPAQIETDNDGQIIIYTGLYCVDGVVGPHVAGD